MKRSARTRCGSAGWRVALGSRSPNEPVCGRTSCGHTLSLVSPPRTGGGEVGQTPSLGDSAKQAHVCCTACSRQRLNFDWPARGRALLAAQGDDRVNRGGSIGGLATCGAIKLDRTRFRFGIRFCRPTAWRLPRSARSSCAWAATLLRDSCFRDQFRHGRSSNCWERHPTSRQPDCSAGQVVSRRQEVTS